MESTMKSLVNECLIQHEGGESFFDAIDEKLRDDEIVKGLDIPDVKKMSKEFLDGYFQVPKVLGEGA
jgi:aspartyl-tRNA(Asn)/glutamyl-tRNA(Gln) amidotransferase subunit C